MIKMLMRLGPREYFFINGTAAAKVMLLIKTSSTAQFSFSRKGLKKFSLLEIEKFSEIKFRDYKLDRLSRSIVEDNFDFVEKEVRHVEWLKTLYDSGLVRQHFKSIINVGKFE